MGKQLDKGTQFPMRPSTALIKDAAGSQSGELVVDASPVDWTAAATKLDFASAEVEETWMDEKGNITLSTSGDRLDLEPGIYKITAMLGCTNDTVAAEDFQLAITNNSGSAVYATSPPVTVPALGCSQAIAVAVEHFTSLQSVAIRAAQVTDTGGATDLTPEDESVFCIVEKIGNVNETGN